MSECLNEGTLQGYLDQELPGPGVEAAARHISGCLACRHELERVRSTALRVDALLDSLGPVAGMSPAIRIRRGPALSGLRWMAMAASILLLFAIAWRVSSPLASPAEKTDVDYFLPLDNGDSMQMGMIVRVSLPASLLAAGDSGEIEADVIISEDGRPHAIRFLN